MTPCRIQLRFIFSEMRNYSEGFKLLDLMVCVKYLFFLLNNFVYLKLVKTKEKTEKPSLGNEKESNQGSQYTSLRPKERGNDYQAYVGDDEYYYDPEVSFPTNAVKFFINLKGELKCFLLELL